jgi:hypothetical protein
LDFGTLDRHPRGCLSEPNDGILRDVSTRSGSRRLEACATLRSCDRAMTTSPSGTASGAKEIDYGDRTPSRAEPFWERTKRQCWVYGGRLWHGLGGGTSVELAVLRRCPIQRRVGLLNVGASRRAVALLAEEPIDEFRYHEDGPNAAQIFAFRRALLAYFLERQAVLVTGHFLFDGPIFAHFHDRYRFVTTMRHPVERMISHYTEDLRNRYLVERFDTYLETNVAWRHATAHLRYLAGMPQVDHADVASALATAKRNLETFDLIGFAEDMDRFGARFGEIFGRRLRIPHVLPGRHYHAAVLPKPTIDRSTRRRLEEMCAADIELYDYARRSFA